MKYWISITTYLWKNIWSRWFESPLSAISKILLTFLLSLLALTLVGVMRQTEQILVSRLSQADILTAKFDIHTQSLSDKVKLENSMYREAIIKRLLESENIEYIRRPYATAEYGEDQRISIIIPFGQPTFWNEEWGDYHQPGVYLFSRPNVPPPLDVTLKGMPLELTNLEIPAGLNTLRGEDHLILLPYPAGYMLLDKGFSESILIRADNLEHLKMSLERIESYLLAEQLRFSVTSSLKILEELQTFTEILAYVRIGLVLLLIVIIAIVLGNQAVLEFREQQYQYALIRSFGVPFLLIIIHDLGEKILLAALGFTGAYYAMPILQKYAVNLTDKTTKLSFILMPVDLYWIGGGVLVGVILSWLFLTSTSRKQIGLVLS